MPSVKEPFSLPAEALLKEVPAFAGLAPSDIDRIGSMLERRPIRGGDVLFRQGQTGNSLYLVGHGRLQVTVTSPDGAERIVAEVGRGETVGEMAILTGEPRSATVRAVRDTLLYRLTRAACEELAQAQPKLMWKIAAELVRRLERGLRPPDPGKRPTSIAVVSVSASVELPVFAKKLSAALASLGATQHVDRSLAVTLTNLRTLSEDDGSHSSELARWLDEQEAEFKYVLYEADPQDPGWTRRCLRQADRIVFVADPREEPRDVTAAAPRKGEGSSRVGTKTDVVFLHADASGAPKGIARWLEALPAIEGATHHVAISEPKDFARLARLLTGNAVGLVLGGGGARGFSHIGVVRALREAGVPIDSVGGTSAGAIIGAQVSLGWDFQTMVEKTRRGFLGGGSLLDFVLPVVSLIGARRFQAMVEDMYGDARIEDQWLRYYAVACSLTHGTSRVLKSGPFWRRVGASMSIPGVGPPVCEKGELLVDGGVLMNLPIEPMRSFCEGRVIAVSVSPRVDLRVDPAFEFYPSVWDILWRKVKAPTMMTLLSRVGTLGREEGERESMRKVDLFLAPDTSSIELLEFKALDRAVEIGYRHTLESLERWQTSGQRLSA
ncbi:MAG TPA: cyclic nucleotide-binding and patatin-like phospholipase domain-containing protein [Thermoanaerobaculia bacterium]|nr:cyclic nucleotide-binding and patatin-like phospholipase domain-containing protein [Thermoanaerobaculia bacterium]